MGGARGDAWHQRRNVQQLAMMGGGDGPLHSEFPVDYKAV